VADRGQRPGSAVRPLDPKRFEVRTLRSPAELAPEVAGHFDLLVATRREAARWPGFSMLAAFESEEPDSGLALLVLRPAKAAARTVAPGRLRASHEAAGVEVAWDADPRSVWQAPEGPGWVETEWTVAEQLDRVEVEVGSDAGAWPQDLTLLGTTDGASWQPLDVVALRPNRPARQREGAPHGQVYVLTPRRTLAGIRIERAAGGPWSLATVRVVAP
jgi:hypothetical protein